MKRSVAILGPTPQFVRWAIWHPCSLRHLDQENLPDDTFRQLRGVRELSNGLREDRVFENICVHPLASSENPDDALGFPKNEVLDVFGTQAFVTDCCRDCPANASGIRRPDIWAGCYGWLPATDDSRFDGVPSRASENKSRDRPQETDGVRIDYVRHLDEAIGSLGLNSQADDLFMKTSPHWFGIWHSKTLTGDQVNFLVTVFCEMVELSKKNSHQAIESDGKSNLTQFRDALESCQKHSLRLHVELIPPGFSDGQVWTLAAHCPDCGCSVSHIDRNSPQKSNRQQQRVCSACGRTGCPAGEQKNKVLGLRPYVRLDGIMGGPNTQAFLRRFELRRNQEIERDQ